VKKRGNTTTSFCFCELRAGFFDAFIFQNCLYGVSVEGGGGEGRPVAHRKNYKTVINIKKIKHKIV